MRSSASTSPRTPRGDGGADGRLGGRDRGWAPCTYRGAPDLGAAVAAFSGRRPRRLGLSPRGGPRPAASGLLGFLEKVSVVDLVCADLADALTGDTDGAAVLDELAASHLFVQRSTAPPAGTGCTGCSSTCSGRGRSPAGNAGTCTGARPSGSPTRA